MILSYDSKNLFSVNLIKKSKLFNMIWGNIINFQNIFNPLASNGGCVFPIHKQNGTVKHKNCHVVETRLTLMAQANDSL